VTAGLLAPNNIKRYMRKANRDAGKWLPVPRDQG
jgi:hypothetical protein